MIRMLFVPLVAAGFGLFFGLFMVWLLVVLGVPALGYLAGDVVGRALMGRANSSEDGGAHAS
ncbi:MAG: hypothetical protein ACRD0K_13955 [Egibacteraceae bacterium]